MMSVKKNIFKKIKDYKKRKIKSNFVWHTCGPWLAPKQSEYEADEAFVAAKSLTHDLLYNGFKYWSGLGCIGTIDWDWSNDGGSEDWWSYEWSEGG